MNAYVVFKCTDTRNWTGDVIAVFTDFQKAREFAIRAVDDGLCDADCIYVDVYDAETGEGDSAWNYGELIDGGEVVC